MRRVRMPCLCAVLLSVSGLVLLASGSLLVRYIGNGQDLVLLRNSLVYAVADSTGSFEVMPPKPADAGTLPAQLVDAVVELIRPNSFDTALALVRYLDTPGIPVGGRIASTTLDTLVTIRAGEGGYCADYTQVFMALAAAAGIAAREWGISFKGYGGDGHALVEVYDGSVGGWVLIDAFNGFYVTDDHDRLRSLLDVRRAILEGRGDTLKIMTITDVSPFTGPDRAVHYLARGIARAYLWQGESTLESEARPLLRWLGRRSPALAQLGAIGLGVHPRMLIVPAPSERAALLELQLLRSAIWCGACSAALVVSVLGFLTWRRGTSARAA